MLGHPHAVLLLVLSQRMRLRLEAAHVARVDRRLGVSLLESIAVLVPRLPVVESGEAAAIRVLVLALLVDRREGAPVDAHARAEARLVLIRVLKRMLVIEGELAVAIVVQLRLGGLLRVELAHLVVWLLLPALHLP